MVRTQIQLTEEQSARARERAAEMGVSVSELIRRGLDGILSQESPNRAARLRALSIIGCVQSETGDLSVEHDKYLEEAYTQ